MGRYYQGDIEGKFWFAVQSSDDATFFGGMETELYASDEDEEEENAYGAQYSFGTDDMEDIEAGLATCKEELGEWKEKLDEFFNGGTSYSNDMIVKFVGLKGDDAELVVRGKLEWYARLILGEKICNCVKENGSCVFEGEY
jgi:hypothetical protein